MYSVHRQMGLRVSILPGVFGSLIKVVFLAQVICYTRAQAPYSARIDGDLLVLTRDGAEWLQLRLGPHESFYDDPAWSAQRQVWRRSGNNGSIAAAAIVSYPSRLGTSFDTWHTASLTQIDVLKPGEWMFQLKKKGGEWVQVGNDNSEKAFMFRRLLTFGGVPFKDGACSFLTEIGPQQVKVGFAIDKGFENAVKQQPDSDIMKFLEDLMNPTNLIYESQLGIHITIGIMLLPQDQWGKSGLDVSGDMSQTVPMCEENIYQRHSRFESLTWTQDFINKQMAAWVQLTDCYRKGETIGLARMRSLCSQGGAAGVVTLVPEKTGAKQYPWIVLAHELGHIFGSDHSFQNGQGKTGGIMDYGDGKYPVGTGTYQFHPSLDQELCEYLGATIRGGRWGRNVKQCFTPWVKGADENKYLVSVSLDHECKPQCVKMDGEFGHKIYEIECRDITNKPVPKYLCNQDEIKEREGQANSQICYPPTCLNTPYWYKEDDFNQCESPYNLDCGSGWSHRKITCKKMAEDRQEKLLKDDECKGVDKPARKKEICKMPSPECPQTHMWLFNQETGSWSGGPECSNLDAYEVQNLECIDVVSLGPAERQQLCEQIKPWPAFRSVSQRPKCPGTDDACCTVSDQCLTYEVKGTCLNQIRRMDALACMETRNSGKTMYFFLGDRFHVSKRCDFTERPYKLSSIHEGFNGLPWDRLDAAVAGPPDTYEMMFFRGDEILRYSVKANAAFEGYPRSISDEFGGLEHTCNTCVQRVSAGIYDTTMQQLRLWCGYGEVYCVASIRWRESTSNDSWTLRPSEDFRMSAVRAAYLGREHKMFLQEASGSICTSDVLGNSWKCDGPPWPYFGTAEFTGGCGKIPFCSTCENDVCKTCDLGYELKNGNCRSVQLAFLASFALNSENAVELLDSGAQDADELSRWTFRGGVFKGHASLNGRMERKFAPVQNNKGDIRQLTKWSLTLWVRATGVPAGVLVKAKQGKSANLVMKWETCGPSVYWEKAESQGKQHAMWMVLCSKSLLSNVVPGEWYQVGFEISDGDGLILHVNGHSQRTELPQHFGALTLDEWYVGNANVDVGMVQVLDHTVKTPLNFAKVSNVGVTLIIVSTVCGLAGIMLIVSVMRVHVPEGYELEKRSWAHVIAEGYMLVCNIVLAVLGIGLLVLMLLSIAWGPAGGEVGFREIFFETMTIPWIVLGLLSTFFAGLLGIHCARSRECCWLTLYLIGVLTVLILQGSFWMYMRKIDPQVASVHFGAQNLWKEGTVEVYRQFRDMFSRLMSRTRYDCELLDNEQAGCAATLSWSPLVGCNQPYAAAKVFEGMVNDLCSKTADINDCGHCIQNFGSSAKIDNWDPTDPVNRVFCKCMTNLVASGKGLLGYAEWLLVVVIVAEVTLVLCIIFLMICAPEKQAMLRRSRVVAQVRRPGHRLKLQLHQLRDKHKDDRTCSSLCGSVFVILQFITGLAILGIWFAAATGGPTTLPQSGTIFLLVAGGMLLVISSFGCNQHLLCGNEALSICYVIMLSLLTLALFSLAILDFGGPKELHLSGLTGIESFTSLAIHDEGARKSWASMFNRDAFDCLVKPEGHRCSTAAGIECKQEFFNARAFENVINYFCFAPNDCETCLKDFPGDASDEINIIWCKCLGALDGLRRSWWLLLVALVLINGAAAAVAAYHVIMSRKRNQNVRSVPRHSSTPAGCELSQFNLGHQGGPQLSRFA